MQWRNRETPTYTGSTNTALAGPDVVETMELVDRDGAVVASFGKSVAGALSLDVGGPVSESGVSIGGERSGKTASYIRTTSGAQTLLPASTIARTVIIVVTVVTTFAAGDGAAPIFDIGETDTVEKFKANLNSGTAGDVLTLAGTLSAGKALLITATAATGTTSTGAIDVTVIAAPVAA